MTSIGPRNPKAGTVRCAARAALFSLSACQGERAGVRWWLALMTLFSSLPLFAAPQTAWTARYAFGTNSDSKVFALALDPQQNIIVAGTSKNDLGNTDYVTAKYNPVGSNLWTRRFDSGGADMVRGLALDDEGNAVLTGTSMTVKYGDDGTELWAVPYGGRGLAIDKSNNVVVTGFSEVDFATVKLTPPGSNVWQRTHDKIGRPDVSQAVTTDKNGNVYVGGLETFFRDGAGDYHHWWIIKYDSSGGKQWGTNFGFDYYSEPRTRIEEFRTDADDNLLFSAKELGITGQPFHTAKIADSGEILWNRSLQSTVASEAGTTATVLDASGNMYVTGGDYLDFPYHFGYLTFKVDNTTGDTLLRTSYAGPAVGYHRANAIGVDSAGNVFVTGQSQPAPTLPTDWATIKYSPSGQEQWVMRYDGPVHGEDQATALAVDNTGAIYAGGFTTTTNGIEMLVIKYVELQNIQVQTNQSVLLKFLGTPGQNYRFQATTNFADWDDLGAALADPLGLYQWLDTNPPVAPYKFYRTVTP